MLRRADSIGPLPLLLALAVAAAVVRRELAGAARDLGRHLEQYLSQRLIVLGGRGVERVAVAGGGGGGNGVGVVDEVHDDGTRAVRAGVLRQVVRPGELLAALMALEGLLLRVEGPVVPLKMLLAPESAVAELAHEGLGRILRQGLLAA